MEIYRTIEKIVSSAYVVILYNFNLYKIINYTEDISNKTFYFGILVHHSLMPYTRRIRRCRSMKIVLSIVQTYLIINLLNRIQKEELIVIEKYTIKQ